jgi:hypothetical protein
MRHVWLAVARLHAHRRGLKAARATLAAAGRALVLVAIACTSALAAESAGQVTFAGQPVPGATVTATKGDTRVTTVSDAQGVFHFADLAEGVWAIRVEMIGFAPLTRDVTIPPNGEAPPWEMALLSFDEIAKALPPAVLTEAAARAAGAPAPTSAGAPQGSAPGTSGPGVRPPPPGGARGGAQAAPAQRGFQRADVSATAPPSSTNVGSSFAAPADDDGGMGAADGLLINGSVNNGASSPFALARAFGNNRPGQRSLYNGSVAFLSNTSALDTRPYSFTGQNTPRPDYGDMQVNAAFGGPLRIPRLLDRRGPSTTLLYQRSRTNSTVTQPGLVPSLLERGGDFSASHDRSGRPVQVVDPLTGQPFPGNQIPRDRISPQASSLLGYYPTPNIDAANGYNYQASLLSVARQDAVQSRLTQNLTARESLTGTLNYTRATTEPTSLFAFVDTSRVSSLNTDVTFSHRLSNFMFLRTRYQLTRQATSVTPFFANRVNVSGLAGISGSDQAAVNWGPPSLTFASGIEGMNTAQYARNTDTTNAGSAELFLSRGRHSYTMGGGFRRQDVDVFSQQNARGGFSFTGGASGSDLADFLLGLPQTSAIAFGNADKALRANGIDAYVNDDWRASATLTLNLGLRWEYEAPFTEARNRLVNLDIARGFTAAQPVLAGTATGPLTGEPYGRALLSADRSGIQPRLGVAWRPVPGSSLVLRGGYGLYRNTGLYQSMALAMAQQPPLSTTSNLETSAARPLTLATGFVTAAGSALNTFAVDPDFRASFAENWQGSVQRDLPMSLTVIGTYFGTRGHRLMQQVLPNTYPAGAVNPCPTCPAGFVYLTSTGRSVRNAGQVQVRRRLRNGFTASAQYTLAKASDNAASFGGAALNGAVIAQNWQDLDAEYARSAFDQRHNLVVQAQYTTGAGITGGTLVDGVKGRLLKDWTFVTQITTGSGLPVTPVYLAPVRGVTGTIRASLTGAPLDAVPDGAYLNPAAYSAPAAGEWGTAARNSVSGPAQFTMAAAVTRTFRWGTRMNLDWRLDATNVLNTVTFAGINTIVGSPQFGLPNRANQMRKLQSSLRLRF